MVPYEICDKCTGEKPEVVATEEIKFHSVSLVTFTPDQIRQVAERLGVVEEDVRAYLAGKRPQMQSIDTTFYQVTGCYPFRMVNASDPQSDP